MNNKLELGFNEYTPGLAPNSSSHFLDDFEFDLFDEAITVSDDARTASSLSSGSTDSERSTYTEVLSQLDSNEQRGTKRKNLDSDNDKKADKLSRNRAAAQRSRTKKKAEAAELIQENKDLREALKALRQENAALVSENTILRQEQVRSAINP